MSRYLTFNVIYKRVLNRLVPDFQFLNFAVQTVDLSLELLTVGTDTLKSSVWDLL